MRFSVIALLACLDGIRAYDPSPPIISSYTLQYMGPVDQSQPQLINPIEKRKRPVQTASIVFEPAGPSPNEKVQFKEPLAPAPIVTEPGAAPPTDPSPPVYSSTSSNQPPALGTPEFSPPSLDGAYGTGMKTPVSSGQPQDVVPSPEFNQPSSGGAYGSGMAPPMSYGQPQDAILASVSVYGSSQTVDPAPALAQTSGQTYGDTSLMGELQSLQPVGQPGFGMDPGAGLNYQGDLSDGVGGELQSPYGSTVI